MHDSLAANLLDLDQELTWFAQVLDQRFSSYFLRDDKAPSSRKLSDLAPPSLADSSSAWACFVRDHRLTWVERLATVLALVPHLRPQLLDVFWSKNSTFDRRFSEFGGVCSNDEFEPTGETLAFLIGGGSLEARSAAARFVTPDHALASSGVVRAVRAYGDQPWMKAPLRVSAEWLASIMTGRPARALLAADFPAQRFETSLQWEDLILPRGTRKQLEEVHTFIVHGETLMHGWDMAARLRPGHRALFHGPPGTGKSLSAALLGKITQRDVYRIDLSSIVSKYIGETEQNLARVFERAQQQGWILFFDEAEALFGKRTETRDAHDRYANQEVAYLLQRIESFGGVAILATNLRENMDDAFMRRFESVVYFPLPGAEDRLSLWRRGLPPKARLAADVDLAALASEHQLSGASIMNVIRHVSLCAIADGERMITNDDLTQGIRRELAKEGRR